MAINLKRHEYFKLVGGFDEYAKGQAGLVICLAINRATDMRNFQFHASLQGTGTTTIHLSGISPTGHQSSALLTGHRAEHQGDGKLPQLLVRPLPSMAIRCPFRSVSPLPSTLPDHSHLCRVALKHCQSTLLHPLYN